MGVEGVSSAIGRAKADVASTSLRHAPGWASVTRALVTLAEAWNLKVARPAGLTERWPSAFRARTVMTTGLRWAIIIEIWYKS